MSEQCCRKQPTKLMLLHCRLSTLNNDIVPIIRCLKTSVVERWRQKRREREREWWLRPIRLRGWELLVFICSSCPYPHRLFIGKRSAYDIQVLDLLLVLGLEVHILVLASQDPILITLRFATASLQIGNMKYKIISAVAGARRGKHRSIYHHVGRAGPFFRHSPALQTQPI